jgi:hypothetical protein
MSAPDPEGDDRYAYRFPWRLMAVVAVVVVVATALIGVVISRTSVEEVTLLPSEAPTARPTEASRQLTLLIQVRDEEGEAASTVLIGFGGGTESLAQLLLPRDLLLPTIPPRTVREVDTPVGQATAQDAVQVLLGVNVDAVIDMDRLAWSGLIDGIGGSLDTEYALDPSSFSLAVTRVLARLPRDERYLNQLLTSLGSMARITVPNEEAARLLALLGYTARTQEVRTDVLPVTTFRVGPQTVAVAQQPEANAVVRDLFPGALLQPGHSGAPRVVLDRGGASAAAVYRARVVLDGAGFGSVSSQAPVRSVPATTVSVPSANADSLALGQAVVDALGLTGVEVVVDPAAAVDVSVVLGNGFTPPLRE